jgi:hypothetical protein
MAQKPSQASATINRQINFQGKIVLSSNSTNISSSAYNMQFKIYSGGDGVVGGGDESLLWTEDHVYGSGAPDNRVTVTDGIFQVNLGSITTLPGGVDFNNGTIWLSINVGSSTTAASFAAASGDGEMSPMVRFTASPYALNSDLLDGLDSTAFGQLSGTNTWSGTNTFNSQSTFNTDIDYTFNGSENLAVTSDLAGSVNVLSVIATPSAITGTTNGIFVQQADSANTNGLDNALTIDNADTSLAITAALKIQNSGGGGYTTIIDNQGTLISGAELNLLDGHSSALVDTATTGTIAITGTGILGAGSIASGFGAIDVGLDNITTTGTIGTAGSTAFTGGVTTFAGTALINNSGTANTTIGNSAGGTISIGASSGSNLALSDAQWSVTGAGVGTFASLATTGNVTVQGGSATLGTTSQAGTLVINDGSGATTVSLTANGVGTSYSLTLPTAAGSVSQCLQTDSITASQLVFAACGAGGGGDSITVNSTAATDANFLNTSATASVAGTTFALNTTPAPDDITLTISDASATVAGIITANAQTFGGLKTFSSGVAGTVATFSGNVSLGSVGAATADSTIHIGDTSYTGGAQVVTMGSFGPTSYMRLQGTAMYLDTTTDGTINIGNNNVANKSISIGNTYGTGDSNIYIGISPSGPQTIAIGSTNFGSSTSIQGGLSGVTFNTSNGGDVLLNQPAGSNLQVTATGAPTVDQLAITNAGQGVTIAGVAGLSINYVGGASAVESSAARIDLTPGGTTGGIWSGLKIVANATGAVSGVTEYGVKINGPATPGAGTETGVSIGTGWDTGLDVQSGAMNMAQTSEPSAAASINLRIYARNFGGRMLLSTKGPSGIPTSLQPALFNSNVSYFAPNTGTVGTGTGFGTIWQSNGTVTHPVAITTAPAIANQIHRTRYANVASTTNQILGPKTNTTSEQAFWRGSAAGLGGFFFNTRFEVDLWPASTARIFAGLSSVTAGVAANDSLSGDAVGLWHDTTDANTVMSIVTRDNSTTTKNATTIGTIAAGNVYEFTMYCPPNGTSITYEIWELVSGLGVVGTVTSTLPRNTVFMGPQVNMSNGTANTTVTTTAIGVSKIYIESDR